MSDRIVYLNGALLPASQARVPVDDRGFVFGDGVYEVLRSWDGAMFQADAHMRRMARGLHGLRIDPSDEAAAPRLLEAARQVLEANGLTEGDATVYFQVTRGTAPRTHAFPKTPVPPTVYISASRFRPFSELHDRGCTVITHADLRWGRCDLKTINLVPNILAKQVAVDAGAFEAVLVREGKVTEGASSNVFTVADGELRTPPLSTHLLAGITREVVIELAAELGMPVAETAVTADDLLAADEVFLVGTTTDVMPVVTVDGGAVNGGQPGPVTRVLQESFAARYFGTAAVAA